MKAQSALEYLMTYGWAILIVIIVGAALYALGVFNPGTFTGHKSTGFSAIQMEDFKFDTTGTLTLMVGNRKGRTITIYNVTADYANTENTTNVGQNLGPNEELTTYISGWNPSEGESYNIEVEIDYQDTRTQINHTDFGTISGSVEPG